MRHLGQRGEVRIQGPIASEKQSPQLKPLHSYNVGLNYVGVTVPPILWHFPDIVLLNNPEEF